MWTTTGAVVIVALAALLWLLLPDGRADREPAAAAPGDTAPTAGGRSAGAAATAGSDSVPPRPGEAPAPGAVIGENRLRAGEGDEIGGVVVDGGAPVVPPEATGPAAGGPGPTPTTTQPDPEPEPTTDAPEPQERTFTSTGGTVRATCTSPDTAKLLSWTPTKPYKVEDVDAGPAAVAVVVYKHGNQQVRMAVTCAGGVPSRS